MAILTTRPRGTNDFLPAETPRWQYVERTLLSTAALYGYGEIRTPTFEHTELFQRGVGDTTDVVNKEMYTFTDKGDRSITLRPEGTAGICRAAIENGLLGDALPLKVSYVINCFRYEKAQRGRFRQFHQFGVECYGATQPVTDAEVISLAWEGMQTLGLKDLTLAVNSIGCPTCRAEYHKALRAYFESRREDLCETCKERLEKNPMRILDCKSPVCGEIAKGAPRVLDYLCDDCRSHFEKVQTLLKDADIPFTVDAGIVRGLDYYTRTVFEISIPGFPALCGGGRYGGLSRQLGGPDVEGIGFAIPIDDVMGIISDLIDYGYVTGAYMGITVKDNDKEAAAQFGLPTDGAYVVDVTPGSSADKAGIQSKDLITAVDDHKITTRTDLTRALRNYKAGDTAQITVVRSGRELTLTITFDEKPHSTTVETAPQEDSSMPSEGDYNDWYEYFRRFFGG